MGTANLASSTPSSVTISGLSPAYTSTGTFVCTVSGQSDATGGLYSVTNLSTSSFQIVGPNNVTTAINFICVGN